jgi:hypothetical protein
MLDLSDVTFTIPLKVESEDRRRVLTLNLNYIKKHLRTHVLICEEGPEPIFPRFKDPSWTFVRYYHRKSDNAALFHKTKNLNFLARQAVTPIIASLDSDVIFHPEQYFEAAQRIRSGELHFCYPFNHANHNIPIEMHHVLSQCLNVKLLDSRLKFTNPQPPPGGCFFMNMQKFIEGGMENENFVCWGPEDVERRDRMRILGYRVGAVPGKLYHLDHSRTENSLPSNQMFKKNEEEYRKVVGMSQEQLRSYIASWSWCR